MLVISKSDFLKCKKKNIELMKLGSVFIYPTDTLYGIGCDATDSVLVSRIRSIKNNLDQPFSVIAPSKEWILNNMKIKKGFDKWLDKLPGHYTLIMELKEKRCISPRVNVDSNSLGVRIPDNWFSAIVEEAGVPIVTTSVNLHGTKPVRSIADIPESIKKMVDFAIDDGVTGGSASTLVNLTKSPPEIIERK